MNPLKLLSITPLCRVSAAPTAALLMDAHAHMSRAEVIGILGGAWDAAGRHMRCGALCPLCMLCPACCAAPV